MCDKDTCLAKTKTQTKHLITLHYDYIEMPRVCKSMFFIKASVLSKCDFIHSTIKAFRKWIYLGWFKLVLLFLCIKFVDKLILPLFLVHTVFMILSLLCALTSPLPSPLLFPREQMKGATIHKIICFKIRRPFKAILATICLFKTWVHQKAFRVKSVLKHSFIDLE